jgi:tetratricopeptide (TPR) repeat protein
MGAFLTAALFFLGQDPVGRILAGYEIRNFSLGERLLTELRVVVFYLGQLLYPAPSRLSLEHDFPISQSLLAPPTTIFAALFLAVLLFLAVKLAGRRRLFSFAILWYLGNLLIESSVIGLEIIFEHRNYLPSMFVVVALVTIVDRLIEPAKAKIALTLGVALIFSFWTYQRSRVWGDEELLIRDSLGKAPNSFRLHYNLGTILAADGRHAEAIEAYHRALQVYPRDSNTRRAKDLNLVYTNLGNALSRTGKFFEADKAYYQALRYNPGDGYAYLGLGINLLQEGKYQLSEDNFRKALLTTNDPTVHFDIRIGLGLTSWRQGGLDEALGHFKAALRLQPGSTRVQGYLVELQKANRLANQSD